MRIVIIGGGKVGFAIAAQLTQEGHDITVVERERSVADNISEMLTAAKIKFEVKRNERVDFD